MACWQEKLDVLFLFYTSPKQCKDRVNTYLMRKQKTCLNKDRALSDFFHRNIIQRYILLFDVSQSCTPYLRQNFEIKGVF